MNDDVVISLSSVSKCFRRYEKPIDRLKEILMPSTVQAEDFWALKDIDFQVKRGETIGFVGQNGSGKSTLLQIIAKTLQPTTGKVNVNGRVSALLELGSGFNPEFTGLQNILFNGKILGLSQAKIESKLDDIMAFAEIGDFIYQPVKTYSSGMFVRLAFAVAIHVEPDIFIVDEALAVGDGIFVHRCMAKIMDLQDQGGTILFVSHDTSSVSRLCSRAIWLNKGKIEEVGESQNVCKHYQVWLYDNINSYQKKISQAPIGSESLVSEHVQPEAAKPKVKESIQRSLNPFTEISYQAFAGVGRFGTGRGEILQFTITDSSDNLLSFVYPEDSIRAYIKVQSFDHIKKLIVGVTIYDRLRVAVTGFNTYQLEIKIPALLPGDILGVEFSLDWPDISGGSYALEAAIADGTQDNHEILDWLQCPLGLQSGTANSALGLIRLSKINASYQILTQP